MVASVTLLQNKMSFPVETRFEQFGNKLLFMSIQTYYRLEIVKQRISLSQRKFVFVHFIFLLIYSSEPVLDRHKFLKLVKGKKLVAIPEPYSVTVSNH
jgi:hypothetical protein